MGINWTMIHGLSDTMLDPSERDEYTAKLWAMMNDQIAIGFHNYHSSLATWASFYLTID